MTDSRSNLRTAAIYTQADKKGLPLSVASVTAGSYLQRLAYWVLLPKAANSFPILPQGIPLGVGPT